MPDVAFVNNWMGPLEEARISVLDRGFLFADGAYEVIRTYDGVAFQLQAHLQRFVASCNQIRLPLPMSVRRIRHLLLDLHDQSAYPDARIYLQATRGIAPRRHGFPGKKIRPSLVAYVERSRDLPKSQRRRGLRTITLSDSRWRYCSAKTLVLLPNVLARQEARDQGADEAILIGRNGFVREGAASNLFIVSRGVLRTHPLGDPILAGVSRNVVLDLARQTELRTEERAFKLSTLYAAEEVMLSSTTLEVVAVVKVDSRKIGLGVPGPHAIQLHQAFRDRVLREKV